MGAGKISLLRADAFAALLVARFLAALQLRSITLAPEVLIGVLQMFCPWRNSIRFYQAFLCLRTVSSNVVSELVTSALRL
jgi:hypothetical protein